MEVSIETTEGLKRVFKITVDTTVMNNHINMQLKQTAKKVRIDGFRKGKVPLSLVEQRYGHAITEEALRKVMQESLSVAFEKHQISPVTEPNLQLISYNRNEPLIFSAEFEIYPEIILEDLSQITLEIPVVEITESDVEFMIKKLQKQCGTWSKKETEAVKGDLVTIDFETKKADEEKFSNKKTNCQIILGDGNFLSTVEEAIIGHCAGENMQISVDLQKNDVTLDAAAVPESKIEFSIHIQSVQSLINIPELTVDFINKLGVKTGTIEELHVEVRKNMERELAKAKFAYEETQIKSQLYALHPIEVPSQLLFRQAVALQQKEAHQRYGDAKRWQELPLEPFLTPAKNQITIKLLYSALLEKVKLTPDTERLEKHLQRVIEVYEDPTEVMQHFRKDKKMMTDLFAAAQHEMLVEHISATAQKNEKTFSYLDFMNFINQGFSALKSEKESVSVA